MKQPEKLVRYSRDLRANMTEAEKSLWHKLRRRQLGNHHIRRQHPIGPYIVDFACIEARLVIELDGGQHCESDYDTERDGFLTNKGWRVLRFWNTQINENIEGVLSTILEALPPSPPPAKPGEAENNTESHLMPNRDDYLKSLARKRNAAALVLLVDGKILIVKPNYKNVWLLPGGVVDELESPLSAARRECREELGFDPVIERLLLVDYRCEDGATKGHHEALHFVFLVKLPADFDVSQLAIPNNELDEWKLVTPADSGTYLSPHSARRVSAALACLNAPTGYAEDGIAKA